MTTSNYMYIRLNSSHRWCCLHVSELIYDDNVLRKDRMRQQLK